MEAHRTGAVMVAPRMTDLLVDMVLHTVVVAEADLPTAAALLPMAAAVRAAPHTVAAQTMATATQVGKIL